MQKCDTAPFLYSSEKYLTAPYIKINIIKTKITITLFAVAIFIVVVYNNSKKLRITNCKIQMYISIRRLVMKKMQCEVCGSNEIRKIADDIFECQSCGVQYSTAETKNCW